MAHVGHVAEEAFAQGHVALVHDLLPVGLGHRVELGLLRLEQEEDVVVQAVVPVDREEVCGVVQHFVVGSG